MRSHLAPPLFLLTTLSNMQELRCTGNPQRVLRALRFGRRVAALFGSVAIDVSASPAPPPDSSSAPISFPSALGRAAADGAGPQPADAAALPAAAMS